MSKEKKIQILKKENNKIEVNEEKYNFRITLYCFFVVGIILLICIAQYFLSINNDIILSTIDYNQKGESYYKVYYKENDYYSEPYLLEGKTYISQYVDYIDVNFEYYVNYTKKISGSYNYYVKAKLIAYTPGNELDDLWDKEYKLTDLETVDFKNDNNYSIFKNVHIDYDKYLNDYTKYRSNSSVLSDAKLVIEFVIDNGGKYADIDIDYEGKVLLEIPISSSTFRIEKTNLSEAKTLKNMGKANTEYIFILIIVVLCWGIAIVLGISFIIVYRNDILRIGNYERKLKKIITTYNSIIVNVENLPSLNDVSVVDVTSFDELVDAQSEVRLPINFKENKKGRYAKFILVSDNIAWVYTLREGDINEKNSQK